MLDQHLGVLAGKVVAGANGHVVCGRVVEIVAPLGLVMTVHPNDGSDDDVYLGGKGSLVEGSGVWGSGVWALLKGTWLTGLALTPRIHAAREVVAKRILMLTNRYCVLTYRTKTKRRKVSVACGELVGTLFHGGLYGEPSRVLNCRMDLMHSLSAHRCPNARNRQFEGIVACQLICH